MYLRNLLQPNRRLVTSKGSLVRELILPKMALTYNKLPRMYGIFAYNLAIVLW